MIGSNILQHPELFDQAVAAGGHMAVQSVLSDDSRGQ